MLPLLAAEVGKHEVLFRQSNARAVDVLLDHGGHAAITTPSQQTKVPALPAPQLDRLSAPLNLANTTRMEALVLCVDERSAGSELGMWAPRLCGKAATAE